MERGMGRAAAAGRGPRERPGQVRWRRKWGTGGTVAMTSVCNEGRGLRVGVQRR